jgi:hypothetical protein
MLTAGDRGAEKVRLENLVLRHQVMILHRQVKHPVYSRRDRALLLTTYFACSSTVQICAGFRAPCLPTPQVDDE